FSSCGCLCLLICFFFFQAEDGIRDLTVTGVQTCALPISTQDATLRSRCRSAPDLLRRLPNNTSTEVSRARVAWRAGSKWQLPALNRKSGEPCQAFRLRLRPLRGCERRSRPPQSGPGCQARNCPGSAVGIREARNGFEQRNWTTQRRQTEGKVS